MEDPSRLPQDEAAESPPAKPLFSYGRNHLAFDIAALLVVGLALLLFFSLRGNSTPKIAASQASKPSVSAKIQVTNPFGTGLQLTLPPASKPATAEKQHATAKKKVVTKRATHKKVKPAKVKKHKTAKVQHSQPPVTVHSSPVTAPPVVQTAPPPSKPYIPPATHVQVQASPKPATTTASKPKPDAAPQVKPKPRPKPDASPTPVKTTTHVTVRRKVKKPPAVVILPPVPPNQPPPTTTTTP